MGYFDDTPQGGGYFGNTPQDGSASPPESEREGAIAKAARVAGDIAVSAGKGLAGIPQIATGLSDAVEAKYTGVGGSATRAAADLGYRPTEIGKLYDILLSPQRQQSEQEVQASTQPGDNILQAAGRRIGALATHPDVLAGRIAENIPSIYGMARMGKALVPAVGEAAPFVAEGLTTIGQNTGQVIEEDPNHQITSAQADPLIATGAITGGIAAASGKIAGHFGIGDFQRKIVMGEGIKEGSEGAAKLATKSLPRRMAESGAVETAEEVLQSGQEQVGQNLAQGKPAMEGVGEASAEGGVVGGILGAHGGMHGHAEAHAAPPPADPTAGPLQAALHTAQQSGAVPTQDAQQPPPDAPGAPPTLDVTRLGGNRRLIANEAQAAGVDPTTALTISAIETGGTFDPNSANKRSSARGLFQFMEATRRMFPDVTPEQWNDPQVQARLGVQFIAQTNQRLAQSLGRAPTTTESYLGHLLGAYGASQLLSADPNASVRDVIAQYDPKRATEIARLNGMGGKTVGEALQMWQTKVAAAQERMGLENSAFPFTDKAAAESKARGMSAAGIPAEVVDHPNVPGRFAVLPSVVAAEDVPESKVPLIADLPRYDEDPNAQDTTEEAPQAQQAATQEPQPAPEPVAAAGVNAGEPAAQQVAAEATGEPAAAVTPEVSFEEAAARHTPGVDYNHSPTEGQAEAGNYKKVHLSFEGNPLSLENPVGSVRFGPTDAATGQPSWQTPMVEADYGYQKRTVGADTKDAKKPQQIDVYLARERTPDAPVFVFDQVEPGDSKFDEHKVVLGAATPERAQQIYDAGFSDQSGPQRRIAMTQLTMPEYKAWVKGDTTLPAIVAKHAMDAQANPVQAAEAAGVIPAVSLPTSSPSTGQQAPPVGTFATAEDATAWAEQNGVAATAKPHEAGGFTLDITPRAPTREETASATEKLKALNSELGYEDVGGITPLRTAPTPELALAKAAAKVAFGVDVVPVATNPEFDGVRLGSDVFVAPTERHVALAITGHELFHRFQDEGIGGVLRAIFSQYAINENKQVGNRLRLEKKAAGPEMDVTRDYARDEVVADMNGSMWLDHKFWGLMAQKDESLFRSVAYRFMQAATKMVEVARGSRFDASTIVKDVDAARNAIAQAWADHHMGKLAGKPVAKQSPALQASSKKGAASFGGAYLDDDLRRARNQFSTAFGMDHGEALSRDYDFVDTKSLKASESVNEERVQALMQSMRDESPMDSKIPPIVADSDGNVLDGHHRLEAARRLGLKQVPVLEKFSRDEGPRLLQFSRKQEPLHTRYGENAQRAGAYVGAPEKYNTPAKLSTLRRVFTGLAKEGESGRYWYERSGRAVMAMVGHDPVEAKKLVSVLAIYSPQSKVDSNSTMALRAWTQYKAGQPISTKTRVQDEQARAVLYEGKPWGGEKTNNFYKNLMREVDHLIGHPDTQGVTVDMWMMRAAGYTDDVPTAAQYRFIEKETARLAKELGWEPQQVQAAIWVAMKARTENEGVKAKTIAQSIKKGYSHYEATEKGRKLVVTNEKAHRELWLKNAMENTPSLADMKAASFDFADGLRRHLGQVSWEARPGRSTGVLPGVNDAPYEQQAEFQHAVAEALTGKNGEDMLAKKLGLLVDGKVMAPGVWQSEVAPSHQEFVSMPPVKGGPGVPKVAPEIRELMNTYADLMGLLLRQDGVGWHKPFFTVAKSHHNGVDIDIGRSLTAEEAVAFEKALGSLLPDGGLSRVGIISTDKGVRTISEDERLWDNKSFRAAAFAAAETALPDFESRSFASDGALRTNDWKESPNGEGYRQRLSASGRSDVLGWAADVLAPRVQSVFDDFSKRYGWGDPGKINLERAPTRADSRAVQDAGRVRGSDDAVAADRGSQRGDARPLEGLPATVEVDGKSVTFGPFQPAHDAARAYMAKAGLAYNPPTTYVKVDRARAERIAAAFDAMKHEPQNPEVKAAYAQMIKETVAQYEALLATGLKVEFMDTSKPDPYGNPRNAILDVVNNNHLWVYPTDDGFGSSADFKPENNPLLAFTEHEISGKPARANDLFRAVHDYFGHIKDGVGFRADGEENAWRSHSAMYSDLARKAMTSETRGQNSWLNFGPHGESNRTAKTADTHFADQKIGLLPQWAIDEGRKDAPFFSRKNVTDTPQFKEWFGGSKVVDAQGKPLVVYHGTKDDIATFTPGTGNFTGSAALASGFAGEAKDGGNVMPVYLAIKNPLRVEDPGFWMGAGFLRQLVDRGVLTQKETDAWSAANRASAAPIYDRFNTLLELVGSKGYDGFVYDNTFEGGGDAYKPFRPEQIKSATGNNGGFDRSNPDIRFSRKIIAGDVGRQYTAQQRAAMDNVGFEVTLPSLKERLLELRKDFGKKMAQGIADQFAPIKELSNDAYMLMRLSKGASGAFEVMLHGGKLKIENGTYNFDPAQRGGVIDKLLTPLQGEHHDFLRWVAANRADALAAQGRENLFTPADIAALKTLADGSTKFDYTIQTGPNAGQVTRDRRTIYADAQRVFNGFNKNVLDLAEQSGLIDGASRKVWESDFYVPFYRVAEDDPLSMGVGVKAGSVMRQKAFERLRGGTEKLHHDLLQNTLQNWAHLLDAAAKNRAAKATMEAAENAGVAIGAPQSVAKQIASSTGHKSGLVWFMDGGHKRFFVVDDPYVLTAISSLEFAGMRNMVMDAMGAFKHYLTAGVTLSPFFKVRNLIRDTIQTVASGPISGNIAKNVAQGWVATRAKSDDYFRLLAGGGTIHFGTMYEGNEAKRVDALVSKGVNPANILSNDAKVKQFYRHFIEPAITAYNELGNRGEAVNRAALYKQLTAQGVDHTTASFMARDLMDFSLQGSFTAIRFLTQVVPFFNARLQGLYKLGRAAKENPARFGAVLGAVTMFSLLLLAAGMGDDDWEKREDWDRNNYWWFKFGGQAFRIPKPFEIGAMATLAERSAEYMFSDQMTGKRLRENVLSIFADNLAFNPTPQLVKPLIDLYANKDSFTGRPIETMGMERQQPQFRFTSDTSMTARAASTALNAVTQPLGINSPSPVMIDHLLRGYFSSMGVFATTVIDAAARPATGQPERPETNWWKTLTGNMVSPLDREASRYVSNMYTQAQAIEQAYGTWRQMLTQGRTAEAESFYADPSNRALIEQYKGVESIKRVEGLLQAQVRRIEVGPGTPEFKREAIQKLQRQRDELARYVKTP